MLKEAKCLLDAGADVNAIDSCESTALHRAGVSVHFPRPSSIFF